MGIGGVFRSGKMMRALIKGFPGRGIHSLGFTTSRYFAVPIALVLFNVHALPLAVTQLPDSPITNKFACVPAAATAILRHFGVQADYAGIRAHMSVKDDGRATATLIF